MADEKLERLARWTPLFILIYFALQFAIRVGFSSNLETDEAQLVGQTHLALGYGNSHPPLYNWLVAAMLWITGSWPVAVASVKTTLLLGTYLLAFESIRMVTGRNLPGLLLVTSFLLLPQIVWKSQITLTHSVLVMFAAVALFHATVRIVNHGRLLDFLWFGLAAAIGGLAKYNFFLCLVAVLAAAYSVPYIRNRFFKQRLLYSALIFVALLLPHLLWAVQHLQESTARLAKLDRENSTFDTVDVAGLGVDGLLATGVAVLAWFAPLGIVWFLIRYASLNQSASMSAIDPERVRHFMLFFGRIALISLAIFAAIILFGDFRSVHERYMTPILIALPFWLVLAWPLQAYARAPIHFLRVGLVLAILMATAWPLWLLFGKEQLAYPYQAFADSLQGAYHGPVGIASHPGKYGANIAVRLPDATMWTGAARTQEVIVLWNGSPDQPPRGIMEELKAAGYKARADAVLRRFRYANYSNEKGALSIQYYERKPDG
jgi:hypothetical protein